METYNGLKSLTEGLPSERYFEEIFFSNEKTKIWKKSWIYFCHQSCLKEPGAYQTIIISDQPIVVVRSSELELKGYYNTCRHRGSLLCLHSEGSISSKRLVCPYHQWSYSSDDGRLLKTSSSGEEGFIDKSQYPLFNIAVKEWRGLIFVNLEPTALWIEDEVFQRSPEGLKKKLSN